MTNAIRFLPSERLAGARVAVGPAVLEDVGPMVAGRGPEGLCFLSFPREAERQIATNLRGAFLDDVEGPVPLDGPVAAYGTAFQRAVWAQLLSIEAGRARTYGEIARELGISASAVGQAVAANPLAVLIPCHRVVPAGGSLGHYAWGATRKKALLEKEGAA